MATCNECAGRSCGSIGMQHCAEQMAEDRAREDAKSEKPVECESCEDADAKFKVVVMSMDGSTLDCVNLCADCARDESWHIHPTGKLECE